MTRIARSPLAAGPVLLSVLFSSLLAAAARGQTATRPAGSSIEAPLPPGRARVTTEVRPAVARPGSKITLVVAVAPPPGFAVYAPGERTYRPVSVSVVPHPRVALERPRYPRPVRRWFRELREWAVVYTRPFEIRIGASIASEPHRSETTTTGDAPRGDRAERVQAATPRQLRLEGRIAYQACDEFVCYLPVDAPLEWTVAVAR
ncbi:MAG TPA: hypothetical protein VNI83_14780 [Vicinamibacterales bacterium]|nr:hypothetical protein [Vicinamibacterales bacterium]